METHDIYIYIYIYDYVNLLAYRALILIVWICALCGEASESKLQSSWPLARQVGGSAPYMLTPFPLDPLDPLDPVDPRMCAQSGLPSRLIAICCFGTFKGETPVGTKR